MFSILQTTQIKDYVYALLTIVALYVACKRGKELYDGKRKLDFNLLFVLIGYPLAFLIALFLYFIPWLKQLFT